MHSKFIALLGGAVLSLGLVNAASAADMAARPYTKAPPIAVAMYNWTGCYIGIQGGGVWGRTKHRAEPLFNVDTTPSFDVSGGEVGGTLGCNYQTGSWVFGIEGDGSWVDASGSANEILPGNPLIIGHTDVRWMATVRGRVGYAFNNSLLYATGGWAGAGVRIGVDARPVPGFGFIQEDHTLSGWTVGAGWEYGFTPNWSFKAEYLYARFDSFAWYNNPVPAGFAPRTSALEVNTFRAGINYRFNWGAPLVAKY